jgi:hypothetical protein
VDGGARREEARSKSDEEEPAFHEELQKRLFAQWAPCFVDRTGTSKSQMATSALILVETTNFSEVDRQI